MRRLNRAHQSGFVAIVLVVVLVVFLVMAAAIVSMTTAGTRGAGEHVHGSAALYLAESGIEWAARSLAEAGDKEDHCENQLPAATGDVNDGGSFEILSGEYLDEPDQEQPLCRVRVAGMRGTARRVVSADIRLGTPGETDSIFDLEPPWQWSHWGGFVAPRTIEVSRNPSCHGPVTNATANPAAPVITDNFSAGEQIYLAADFTLVAGNPPPGRSVMRIVINHTGGSLACNVDMAAPAVTNCPVDPTHALYAQYNLVLDLGTVLAANQINAIIIEGHWEWGGGGNTACTFQLADACLGRQSFCLGSELDDDPVEEGSWNEDP